MFNIGFTELLILGVIALIVIGPEQLPAAAKKLASLLNELKRAKDEIMSPVEDLRMQAQKAVEEVRRKADEQMHAEVTQIMNKIQPQADAEPEIGTHSEVDDKQDKKDDV
jgi:sec-independent protein translocase protein TatB